jgi:protein SCO1
VRPILLLLILVCLPGSAMAFDPFSAAGIDPEPGAAVPMTLSFARSDGSYTTLGELAKGKPLLLAPVLHRCPNICGVTLSGLMQAIAVQKFRPGEDFTVIAFSIDPEEKPDAALENLQALRKRFPELSKKGVYALTGTQEHIRSITNALGYRYAWDEKIRQYAHIAAIAVLTPEGRLGRWLYGLAPSPGDVRLALAEAGGEKIGSFADQLLLLCYPYDPQTGQYSSIIWTMLRAFGGMTVVLGGLALGHAFWRERRKSGREKA